MKSGNLRSESTRQKRATILGAALRCFDAQGVVSTTMEDIRIAAKVSVGSLYHHFPSKEEIAAALYVSLIGDYQASAEEAVLAVKSPKARIRAAVKHHIEWSGADPARARFLLSHREPEVARLSDPEISFLNRSLGRTLQEWLDREAARGSVRKMSADIYVSLVIGPAQSFVRRWMSSSTTTTPEKAIKELSDAAWRAVRLEPRTALIQVDATPVRQSSDKASPRRKSGGVTAHPDKVGSSSTQP